MRYRFADCLLDAAALTLLRGDAPVRIEPGVFDLIHLLVRHPDRLVTRDEMVAEVWSGRIVSESAISARIAAARKAVGDDGKRQAVIRTVSRRGLQMAVPVSVEDRAGPETAAPLGTQAVRYARNARGRVLAWAATGQGSPVLRIDYMGRDLEDEWATPIERQALAPLLARHRLIRFDAVGIGQSRPAEPETEIGQLVGNALTVADAAGADRFAVFAESGGAAVAFALAALHPDRVSRLVTLGGYARGPARRESGPLPSLPAMVEESWTNPGSAMASAHLMPYMPDGPMHHLHLIADLMRRATTPEAERQLRRFHADVDVTDLLPRITCPTLLIHSRHDRVHPLSEARLCAAAVPDAELVVLETANHVPNPHLPVWVEYVTVLTDFLGRGDPEARAPARAPE